MWEPSDHLFAGKKPLPPDEDLPEDELDKLFMANLPQLKPPPGVIKNILSTISLLPKPRPEDQTNLFNDPELPQQGPIVHNERRKPS